MISSFKARHDWCVGASHCSSAFLGLEICFLVRKLYQETGGHMLTLKIGTMKVFWTIWVGPVRPLPWTGQTSPLNRSDRSRQVWQIENWTAPLRRSRRDDRNAYIERLIRSPDEGVMPPRRPAPRSNRSRAVRPVRNAQSELGVVFWHRIW